MTKISRQLDMLIQAVVDNEYQLDTNKHGVDLLKIDLEKIFDNAEKDADEQREYVRNLEEELQHVVALLEKFKDK